MFTDVPGLALVVLAADCAPVLLADPRARVVGAAHAGREGMAAGVVTELVAAMSAAGADPARMHAVIGPHICGGCYEVPEEMRARVAATGTRGGLRDQGGHPRDRHQGRDRGAAGPGRGAARSPATRAAPPRHPGCTPTAATAGPAGSPAWSGWRHDAQCATRLCHVTSRRAPTARPDRRDEIAARLAAVRARIAAACEAAGRGHGEVTLIAVTKTYPVSDIRLLGELGVHRHRGEPGPGGGAQGRRVRRPRSAPDLALRRSAADQQGRQRGLLRRGDPLGGPAAPGPGAGLAGPRPRAAP